MNSRTLRISPASRSVGVGEDVESSSVGVGFDLGDWRRDARSSYIGLRASCYGQYI